MGKSDIKQTIANLKCWRGEAQALVEMEEGRPHQGVEMHVHRVGEGVERLPEALPLGRNLKGKAELLVPHHWCSILNSKQRL